jgi:hypothetical protein
MFFQIQFNNTKVAKIILHSSGKRETRTKGRKEDGSRQQATGSRQASHEEGKW